MESEFAVEFGDNFRVNCFVGREDGSVEWGILVDEMTWATKRVLAGGRKDVGVDL